MKDALIVTGVGLSLTFFIFPWFVFFSSLVDDIAAILAGSTTKSPVWSGKGFPGSIAVAPDTHLLPPPSMSSQDKG